MRYAPGNMWTFNDKGNVWVIPTNGSLDSQGLAVMGVGVARQASAIHKDIPEELGKLIHQHGNHVFLLPYRLVSFPVKRRWEEQADLGLIERSAMELGLLGTIYKWPQVIVPAVGCGNGNRTWKEVGPILTWYLEHQRYLLVHNRPLVPAELPSVWLPSPSSTGT